MIKWNRTYTLLTVVIVLFLALIWYYGQLYLLEPARESLNESERVLAEHQALFDLEDAGVLSLKDIEADADAIQLRLPTEKNVDLLIRALEEIESRMDVLIDHISLENDALNTDLDYYPNDISDIRYQINFTAETFADFEAFITHLNNQQRIVEIDQLTIQQTSTDGVTGTVAIRYFYNENVNFD